MAVINEKGEFEMAYSNPAAKMILQVSRSRMHNADRAPTRGSRHVHGSPADEPRAPGRIIILHAGHIVHAPGNWATVWPHPAPARDGVRRQGQSDRPRLYAAKIL